MLPFAPHHPALEDFLKLKKAGYFTVADRCLTIHRTGEPDETIYVATPAEANRLRLELADGLAGLIEGTF